MSRVDMPRAYRLMIMSSTLPSLRVRFGTMARDGVHRLRPVPVAGVARPGTSGVTGLVAEVNQRARHPAQQPVGPVDTDAGGSPAANSSSIAAGESMPASRCAAPWLPCGAPGDDEGGVVSMVVKGGSCPAARVGPGQRSPATPLTQFMKHLCRRQVARSSCAARDLGHSNSSDVSNRRLTRMHHTRPTSGLGLGGPQPGDQPTVSESARRARGRGRPCPQIRYRAARGPPHGPRKR